MAKIVETKEPIVMRILVDGKTFGIKSQDDSFYVFVRDGAKDGWRMHSGPFPTKDEAWKDILSIKEFSEV